MNASCSQKLQFAVVAILSAIILSACSQQEPENEWVVLTRNAATTWYEGRDGLAAGPEHDLVMSFASLSNTNTKVTLAATEKG